MMLTPSNDFDPIYFMDLPSPLNYYEFDGSIFHGHDQSFIVGNDISQSPTINEPILSTPSKMVMSKGDIVNEITVQQDYVSNKKVSRRGPYKGDRHSKIPTAHGLRDRRMRLSLDVARQFFKLQDMLSFDKPSKTVKWLLLQAKSAIEEMGKAKESPSADATKCASSTSEGEVVESAIDEEIINDHQKAAISKGKVKRTRKNVAASPPVPKQVKKKAREEARERARERTHKKNQAKLFEGTHGLGDDSGSQTHNMKPSSDVIFEIEQHFQEERNHFQSIDQGFPTTNWNSMMSLSYHQEAQEGDACQINPIQEFHQTPREPYSHPHLGQYWYF